MSEAEKGGDKPIEPSTTPADAAPKPKGGLDLSKLLSKAKGPAAQAAPVELPVAVAFDPLARPVAPPVAEKPKEPPKPVGVGGRMQVGQVGTLGGVKKANGPLAAPTAKTEAPKALPNAAPVNRKIEAIASRQGAKADRLNVMAREERKYPYGCFGVDELYVFFETMYNTVRGNVWKVKNDFSTFTIGVRYVGSQRREMSIAWDGTAFTVDYEKVPDNVTALATVEADLAIDYVRGVMSCVATEFDGGIQFQDEQALLWKLKVMRWNYQNESLTEKLKEVDGGLQDKKNSTRERSKDAIDFLMKYTELKVAKVSEWIIEPMFLRFIVEDVAPVDVLFHFQKGQYTIIRSKPGESLDQGAIDIMVSKRGLQALWDRECQFHFAFLSGMFRAQGDLALLRKFHICNSETIRRIKAFNVAEKPSSQAEPLLVDVRTSR